jgi:hypothetical protein
MWHTWEGRIVCKVLVGKPEGKRPLRRPRHRWENRIRMDIKEIGWGRVEWIQLAQDRDRRRAPVNATMNLLVLAPRISILLKQIPTFTNFHVGLIQRAIVMGLLY